ncbi:MAG: hypothetical protein ACE5EX_01000 [Phycisphaerae bacterium]
MGSVLEAVSRARCKAKWLEIVCDLMRPAKQAQFTTFTYHSVLRPLWRPAWYELIRDVWRGNVGVDAAWTTVLADGTIQGAMPTDPTGRVPVLDTWVWSDIERRMFFIVAMDEATMTSGQIDDAAGETRYVDPPVDAVEDAVVTPGLIRPLHRIDYIGGDVPGLSAATLTRIADRTQIVHPRLDLPLDSVVLRDSPAPPAGQPLPIGGGR